MSELIFQPAQQHPELVSDSVFEKAKLLSENDLSVAEIDPTFANVEELSKHYGIDIQQCINCIIIQAVYADTSDFVACLIPVGHKADFNGAIRKYLNAKRVSLAPLEDVLSKTGMEHGSI